IVIESRFPGTLDCPTSHNSCIGASDRFPEGGCASISWCQARIWNCGDEPPVFSHERLVFGSWALLIFRFVIGERLPSLLARQRRFAKKVSFPPLNLFDHILASLRNLQNMLP